MPKHVRKSKNLEGEGIVDILKGVNKFLRKHKVISRGSKLLAPVSGSLSDEVKTIGKVAGQLGYGKSINVPRSGPLVSGAGRRRLRRAKTTRGVVLKGTGLKLAGSGRTVPKRTSARTLSQGTKTRKKK